MDSALIPAEVRPGRHHRLEPARAGIQTQGWRSASRPTWRIHPPHSWRHKGIFDYIYSVEVLEEKNTLYKPLMPTFNTSFSTRNKL